MDIRVYTFYTYIHIYTYILPPPNSAPIQAAAAAVAAAKSLQSCLTRCDPIDGSPPGFAIPGILQADEPEYIGVLLGEITNKNVVEHQKLTINPKNRHLKLMIIVLFHFGEGAGVWAH